MSERTERRVFVDYIQIENRGHILEAWSDEERYSYGACSCGHWMSGAATDAEDVLASWRLHVVVLGLSSGQVEDEELSRLFLGSALVPEPDRDATR